MSGYIGTQPVPQATQTRDSFTCTAGQTSFATSGYTPNFLDVYLNGVKLTATDYTASNGSDVVLAAGASTGDVLEVVAFTTFEAANVTGATDFTVTGNLSVDGGTIKLDGNYPVGGNNVMLGSASGTSLTTGYNNVAIGPNAFDAATDAHSSIAIGQDALTTNTTGAENTAVGQRALYLNTTGGTNVALGRRALENNTTASNNTAVGYQAAYSNTTGVNTAIGQSALYANTTGTANTAIGKNTLGSNTISNNNTAVGYQALYSMTGTGTTASNTAVGYYAGRGATTGYNNVYLGQNSGYYGTAHTTGTGSTYLGSYAGASAAAAASELVIAAGGIQTGKGNSTGFISPAGGGVYQGNNSSSWSTTSDRRLKKNIVDSTIGLAEINQLQVRNFEYRTVDEVTELEGHTVVEKSGVQVGVIAQEIQAILPNCVREESTGVLSVDPDNLTWHLIKAVQELSARLEALENA